MNDDFATKLLHFCVYFNVKLDALVEIIFVIMQDFLWIYETEFF